MSEAREKTTVMKILHELEAARRVTRTAKHTWIKSLVRGSHSSARALFASLATQQIFSLFNQAQTQSLSSSLILVYLILYALLF